MKRGLLIVGTFISAAGATLHYASTHSVVSQVFAVVLWCAFAVVVLAKIGRVNP